MAIPEVEKADGVDPTPIAEKEIIVSDEKDIEADRETKDDTYLDDFAADPFKPFDDLPPEKRIVITIRGIVIGCICGALVNASNVYLGLKTGWTFTANLFGSIAGFAVLKGLSNTVPENFPILGGSFGPRENAVVQTASMAAGGMSSVFISGIPAMYQLDLLSTPTKDFGRLIALTAVGGYFGFAFATPLRKFFVVYVARELHMIFPTPSATALTIRSMHQAVTGEAIGKLKMKALSAAFMFAMILRIVSQYVIGILWDWHVFTWFFIWGNYHNGAIAAENWGWFIEWTPAFIGSGMLVGLNVSLSMLAGSVIAWGIIGPSIVHNGVAFGKATTDEKWHGMVNYMSLGGNFSSKDHPSPRYWMIWPGVLLMIAVAFTELLLQWRVLGYAFKAAWRGLCNGAYELTKRAGKDIGILRRWGESEQDNMVEDSAADEDLVKAWMWAPLLIVSIITFCVVLGVLFDMPVGMSLLSVVLAFFFSFVAIQCTGPTDVTPLTAASKASQIILGGATKGEHWTTDHAQRLNLLGGALASIAANQSTDLVCDFRTGFLLRTPPIQQWIAQGLGTIVAVFLAPAMFVLFSNAYPCIIDTSADTCPFAAPSVSAWRAVAVAVTDPTFPIPASSGIFAIVIACIGVFMTLVRHYVWVGRLEWMRAYHPNMMCIGLSFTLTSAVYGIAMVIGSALAVVWSARNPKSFDLYGYAVAAGLIAGEGIGGVINAIFQIAGISGDKYGTNIACPGDAC